MQEKYRPVCASRGSPTDAQPLTVLVPIDRTCRAYMLAEAVAEPGAGLAAHLHHHACKAFYVLDGEFTLMIGSENIVIGSNSCVCVPEQVCFKLVNTGPSRARVLIIAGAPQSC